MALTHVELYEALKGTISDEAARLIAEVVPPAKDLATREDLLLTKTELRAEIADVRLEIAGLRGEMHSETTRTIQWILGVIVPMLLGTWGTMVAVLLKA